MLTRLIISDVVLVDRLELDLKPGLSVLTGETGAGKSIILDSLGLATGARSDTGLIRAGAAQAAVTAEFMGNRVERIHDVGVAGLHRMLARLETIQQANVIVAVAGMEGALPSVLAGLVAKPVIAVPTSIGYGASFGGIAALLAMLNSCASGVTVVNIDNGFGAGYAASQINTLVARE